MDHPSVELRLPFDGEQRRLTVPPDTTRFYWGAVGVGTVDAPPGTVRSRLGVGQSELLEATRDRIGCSLAIDGEPEPLLREVRRSGDRREHAYWKATDPQELPSTVTVELATSGPAPTVADDPVALWTAGGDRIRWGETVRTDLRLVPGSDDPPMRTDGLWSRHDVYVPQPVDGDRETS